MLQYFQCTNSECAWDSQLVILESVEIYEGVRLAPPQLICDCGMFLFMLTVRKPSKSDMRNAKIRKFLGGE